MEAFIQIIILICLIVVIILLLYDKVKIIKPHDKSGGLKDNAIPDVVGKALTPGKEKTPIWLANRKKLIEQMAGSKGNDSVKKIDNGDNVSNSYMEEPIDDIPPDDDRFGQGVSINELKKVGNLLQQDELDEAQEQETSEIIQKIQGTEFFSMMQESIEGASQKIARLLDKSLSQHPPLQSGSNKSSDIENFDIGDFI